MSKAEPERPVDETFFIFWGGDLALDLVNTEVMERGKQKDLLTTPEALASWWQAARRHYPELEEWCEANKESTVYDLALLNAVKTFRTALRRLFSALVAANTPEQADVADSRGFQALCTVKSHRFSVIPQGLVNHAHQGLVNHARRSVPSEKRLTSLFKPIRKRLR